MEDRTSKSLPTPASTLVAEVTGTGLPAGMAAMVAAAGVARRRAGYTRHRPAATATLLPPPATGAGVVLTVGAVIMTALLRRAGRRWLCRVDTEALLTAAVHLRLGWPLLTALSVW